MHLQRSIMSSLLQIKNMNMNVYQISEYVLHKNSHTSTLNKHEDNYEHEREHKQQQK
jgi:hypothetical protein